jgi:hypothetical protein
MRRRVVGAGPDQVMKCLAGLPVSDAPTGFAHFQQLGLVRRWMRLAAKRAQIASSSAVEQVHHFMLRRLTDDRAAVGECHDQARMQAGAGLPEPVCARHPARGKWLSLPAWCRAPAHR